MLVVSHRAPLPARVGTRSLAGDLARLLDEVADRPAVVIGHSMGGMVAQHLAADRPDLVDGLVLSSTLARADRRFVARLERWDRLLRAQRWEAFHRDGVRASFTGRCRDRQLRGPVDGVRPPPSRLVDRHLARSRACARHDATGVLGRTGCSTLVLAGRQDVLTPADHARDLAARLPNATLVVLDGAGHALPEQRPGAYRRAVLSFLTGHGGRGRRPR